MLFEILQAKSVFKHQYSYVDSVWNWLSQKKKKKNQLLHITLFTACATTIFVSHAYPNIYINTNTLQFSIPYT